MRKIFKIFLVILLVIVIGIVAIGMYVKTALPNVGEAENITIEYTPERIARGEYLANHVTVCIDCHSTRDWNYFSGPITPGNLGGGGERFGKEIGLPGTIYSRNITPYRLSDWTDGEVFRLITTGVSKDGHAIFPLMPYKNYGKMDREDLYCIISYIRSLPAVKNEVPESELDFPVNFIVNTIPEKAELGTRPDTSDVLNYGKYVINAAGCVECHSQVDDKGNRILGTEFGGGRGFIFPGGVVHSANITTDATGIASMSKDAFIALFKMYADSSYQPAKVAATDYNTPMPWVMYAGMTEQDLGAIYDYLQTVKPLNNKVVKFEKH